MIRRLELKYTSDSGTELESVTVARFQKVLGIYSKIRPTALQSLSRLYDLAEDLFDLSAGLNSSRPPNFDVSSDPTLDPTLVSILRTTSDISKNYKCDIQEILGSIPNQEMDPSTKEHLTTRLEFLGHYLPTASRLLKYARRFSHFKAIHVQPVFIAPIDLVSQISATDTLTTQPLGPSSVLNATPVFQESENSILNREIRARNYKVHAEVQLLMHYESKRDVRYRPRVLKSSKDACFLCDLFIKAHGKFYIPKTHGKVYDLWILPSFDRIDINEVRRAQLVTVVEKFNTNLEELLQRDRGIKKPKLKDPRESGIFSLVPSTIQAPAASEGTLTPRNRMLPSSSAQAIDNRGYAASIEEVVESFGPSQNSSNVYPDISPDEHKPAFSHSNRIDSMGPDMQAMGENALASPTITPTPKSTATLQPLRDPPSPHIIALQPGVSQFYDFGLYGPTIRFHTPRIHLVMSRSHLDEVASQSSLDLHGEETRCIRVEALLCEKTEAERIMKTDSDSIVNLGQEWPTSISEGILFEQSGLLFRKKSELVQLKASYIDSSA